MSLVTSENKNKREKDKIREEKEIKVKIIKIPKLLNTYWTKRSIRLKI